MKGTPRLTVPVIQPKDSSDEEMTYRVFEMSSDEDEDQVLTAATAAA